MMNDIFTSLSEITMDDDNNSRLGMAIRYEAETTKRVKTIDGFSYLKNPYVDKQKMRSIVNMFPDSYKALYMNKVRTVRMGQLDCKLYGSHTYDYDKLRLKNRFLRMIRLLDQVHSSFRIATDNCLYTFDMGAYRPGEYLLSISQTSVNYRYARFGMFNVTANALAFAIYPEITGDVVLDVDGKMPKEELEYFAENTVQYLQLLTYACNLMLKSQDINLEYYTYTEAQTDVMLELFQRTNSNCKRADIVAYQAHSWINSMYKDKVKTLEPDDINDIIDDIFTGCEQFDSLPLLDFGTREFNWIYKYCKDHEYNITAQNRFVDLSDILINQRYGLQFRICCDYDNQETFEAGIMVKYDIDTDDLRFFIVNENRDKHFVTILIVDYSSASHFNTGNFTSISELHIVGSSLGGKLPANMEEACKITPLSYINLEGIIKIIINIVQVLIVIHDRPERNRMITEEHPRQTNQSSKANADKPNYVIRRIIKTTYQANKYMKEKSLHGDKDVRYTIEQWERCGHYRTYKNGKRIWIEETTCHRHKELSAPIEIRIKL